MADPDIATSHQVQVILGQQLLDAGANVNAKAGEGLGNVTPLHRACHSATVINLGFIRLLLEHGANPNALSVPQGETPLMHTLENSMPAAVLLLTFPSKVAIDVNVRSSTGSTFLGGVRQSIKKFQQHEVILQLGGGSSPEATAKRNFILKQFLQVEALLVEKGAIDNGWKSQTNVQEGAAMNTNPLSYDVGILLDKNLLEDGPGWYKECPFWISDALSIQFELFQKKPHLHSGFNNGLYPETNKKPVVGQKVAIHVNLPNTPSDSGFGLLTGQVVRVFDEPTVEDLRISDSGLFGQVNLFYCLPCVCPPPIFDSLVDFLSPDVHLR